MVLFNYSTKELTAKIVYYGPGLCGKTTNLQYIHQNLSDNVRGKMLSLATKTDRTLFFDFLPMDLGEIRGMKTRIQLYTVPGQVFYNETRKLVLKGADGIVFVADSQKEMLGPNIESFKNLEENLKAHGMNLSEMPHVIQFNKRDLPKLSSIEELNASLNKFNAPFYESVATTGIGVQDSLKAITKLVLLHLTKKYDPRTGESAAKPAAAAPAPTPSVSTPAPAAAAPTPTPAEPVVAPQPAIQVPTSQPAAAAVASAPVASAPVATMEPQVNADELDDLVSEVQGAEADAAPAPVVPAAPAAAPSTEVSVGVAASPVEAESVSLTDALSDHDLFDDPSLEVAKLTPGELREIVIPVNVAGDGAAQRYTLSLKLRLDRVD